jgi:hypothetical protein
MSIAPNELPEHDRLVAVAVNTRPVKVDGPRATGLQIKEAAIAQGLPIQLTFQLSEKLADHKAKIIGNDDTVTLHEGEVFVCVADDDNS